MMQLHAARYPYPRYETQDWAPLHREYKRPPIETGEILPWPFTIKVIKNVDTSPKISSNTIGRHFTALV